MIIYTAVIGLTAGIYLGFSILYMFIGLRRKDSKPLNISFALFASGKRPFSPMQEWFTLTEVNQSSLIPSLQ